MEIIRPGSADGTLGAVSGVRARPKPASFGAAWSLVLFVADLLSLFLAIRVAEVLVGARFSDLEFAPGALQAMLFASLLWLILFERIGMYQRSFSMNARDEVYASLAASAMAMLPALAIFLLVPGLVPFRHLLIGTLLLTALGVSCSRYAAHTIRSRMPLRTRRIAVVGMPARVAAVPMDLSLTKTDSILRLPVDTFDEDVEAAIADGDITSLEWLRTALDRGVDEVIVTEALPSEIMPTLLRYLESRGVKLAFAPMRIRPHACDFTVRRDGGLALLYPRSLTICRPGAETARRAFDLALALPALALLSPLLLLIALAVKLDSAGPVLYRQRRVGRHGVTFDIIKFRTMEPDAEATSGPVWADAGEARKTRVGAILRRLSLDELPQLFNVVRGDMSIVGPRPERPYYVEQFRRLLPRYEERHLVRPGITGWSHVNMKRNVDTSAIGERLSYDLFYLEHWSIFMDILIICKTGAEFLFHAAA
ncbi:MAG: exopolysaccharide biosynthesis polyprenyl glycosylphosphotransferase [Candidatus Eremiobacteraeota bacterium]|nr:exopolysaccharide biosynthesis polyprenyl glycosylphosphotransferase [Candidatus Eremiobacteraeota bacterium]